MQTKSAETSTPPSVLAESGDLDQQPKPRLWPWIVFVLLTFLFNTTVYTLFTEFIQPTSSFVSSVVLLLTTAIVSGEFCIAMVVCGFWGRTWLEGYGAAMLFAFSGYLFVCVGEFVDRWSYGMTYSFSLEILPLCDFPVMLIILSSGLLLFRAIGSWRLTGHEDSLQKVAFGITDLIIATALVASLLMLGRSAQDYGERTISEYWAGIAVPSTILALAGLIAVVPTVWIVFRATRRRTFKLLVLGSLLSILSAALAPLGVLSEATHEPFLNGFILNAVGTSIIFTYLVVGLFALRKTGLVLKIGRQPTGIKVLKKESRLRRFGVPAALFTCIFVVHLFLSFAIAAREAKKLSLRQEQRAMVARGGRIEFYPDDSGAVMSIDLSPSATRAELEKLHGYESLDYLSLADMSDVTDRDVLFLKTLRSLSYLDLRRTSITDASLEQIAECPNLRTLSIAGTKCTATGISKLVARSSLQHLNIGYLDLDDDDIEDISSQMQSGLTYSLGLSGNPITNACFAKLHSNANIFALDLTDCDVDEGCLILDKYDGLNLDGTRITDAAFATWLQSSSNGTPPKIGGLSVDRTAITENILDAFSANMPSSLKFGEASISEQSLSRLGLGPINNLTLNSTKFTGDCFQTWRPAISSLDMSGSGVTDAAIEYIVKLPDLYSLILKNTNVSDSCLKTLAKSDVRQINLSRTRVTAAGLSAHNWDSKVVWLSVDQFSDAELTALLSKKSFGIDYGPKDNADELR